MRSTRLRSFLFCAAAACSGATAAPGERLVRPEQLHVSAGRAQARADAGLLVTDACFRAVSAPAPSATLHFNYLGPTSDVALLGSGELRRQIGLKLRAQDTCNVVYVMWHIEPDAQIEVSVKHNPGMTTHAQCRDHGYSFVQPQRRARPPLVVAGGAYTLHAELHGRSLRVEANQRLAWQGVLPAAAFEFDGPIGVRSDNARYTMRLGSSAAERHP